MQYCSWCGAPGPFNRGYCYNCGKTLVEGETLITEKPMLRVFIVEEYGWRHWTWNFPGTKDELVQEWKAGRTPRGIGYVGHRDFLGTVEEVETPSFDPDPDSQLSQAELDDREDEFVNELNKMWQVFLSKYEVVCEIHEESDSYLNLNDGRVFKWEADVDHDQILAGIIEEVGLDKG